MPLLGHHDHQRREQTAQARHLAGRQARRAAAETVEEHQHVRQGVQPVLVEEERRRNAAEDRAVVELFEAGPGMVETAGLQAGGDVHHAVRQALVVLQQPGGQGALELRPPAGLVAAHRAEAGIGLGEEHELGGRAEQALAELAVGVDRFEQRDEAARRGAVAVAGRPDIGLEEDGDLADLLAVLDLEGVAAPEGVELLEVREDPAEGAVDGLGTALCGRHGTSGSKRRRPRGAPGEAGSSPAMSRGGGRRPPDRPAPPRFASLAYPFPTWPPPAGPPWGSPGLTRSTSCCRSSWLMSPKCGRAVVNL